MAEKNLVIDEKYRQQMAKDAEIHKDNLMTDLMEICSVMNKYIIDADVLLRKYRTCQREYEEIYAERYDYHRFRGEVVCNDRDADKKTRGDKEVIAKKKEMDTLEVDFDMIVQFKELLKTKGFQIKNIIDYEKFRMGE